VVHRVFPVSCVGFRGKLFVPLCTHTRNILIRTPRLGPFNIILCIILSYYIVVITCIICILYAHMSVWYIRCRYIVYTKCSYHVCVWTVDGRMATGYHTCAAVLGGRDCPFALYSWTVFPSDEEKNRHLIRWRLYRTQPSSDGGDDGTPRKHTYYNVVYILITFYNIYTRV